jgi:hypothetical protein
VSTGPVSSEALERRHNLWNRVQLLRANEFDAALEIGDPQVDWSDAYVEDVPWLLAEVARLEQEITLREESQIPVIPRGAQAVRPRRAFGRP